MKGGGAAAVEVDVGREHASGVVKVARAGRPLTELAFPRAEAAS